MSKTTTLHRWSLVDKSGKTRLTCTSTKTGPGHGAVMRDAFTKMRGGKPIPEGWKLVCRGPVKEQPAPVQVTITATTTAQEPRPFKVGDRVEHISPERSPENAGKVGTVVPKDGWMFGVRYDGETYVWGYNDPSVLRHVEIAPEPKPCPLDPQAEKLLEEARETIRNQADTIGALTAERNEARKERDEALFGRDRWAHEAASHRDQCAVLAAKLDDIRAIQRVAEMVHALPEGHEDWHFQGLIQDVLER